MVSTRHCGALPLQESDDDEYDDDEDDEGDDEADDERHVRGGRVV